MKTNTISNHWIWETTHTQNKQIKKEKKKFNTKKKSAHINHIKNQSSFFFENKNWKMKWKIKKEIHKS